MFEKGICLTRANLIYYMRLEDAFGGVKRRQKCIEKTSLFFEHKGTRIFLTRKPLIKKKLHNHYFLNYTLFLANKTVVFLDKPLLQELSTSINMLILFVLAGFDPQSHPLFI